MLCPLLCYTARGPFFGAATCWDAASCCRAWQGEKNPSVALRKPQNVLLNNIWRRFLQKGLDLVEKSHSKTAEKLKNIEYQGTLKECLSDLDMAGFVTARDTGLE